MDIQNNIKTKIKEILASLSITVQEEEITLSQSDNRDHGDYASNIAFKKAKEAKMAPLALAEKIAELSPKAKVICGFTPSGMEQQEIVQLTKNNTHPNIEFITGENWSAVIRQLRKRLPLNSQHLHKFKKVRKKQKQMRNQRYCLPKQYQR